MAQRHQHWLKKEILSSHSVFIFVVISLFHPERGCWCATSRTACGES